MVKMQSYHLSKGIKNFARLYGAFEEAKPSVLVDSKEKRSDL